MSIWHSVESNLLEWRHVWSKAPVSRPPLDLTTSAFEIRPLLARHMHRESVPSRATLCIAAVPGGADMRRRILFAQVLSQKSFCSLLLLVQEYAEDKVISFHFQKSKGMIQGEDAWH